MYLPGRFTYPYVLSFTNSVRDGATIHPHTTRLHTECEPTDAQSVAEGLDISQESASNQSMTIVLRMDVSEPIVPEVVAPIHILYVQCTSEQSGAPSRYHAIGAQASSVPVSSSNDEPFRHEPKYGLFSCGVPHEKNLESSTRNVFASKSQITTVSLNCAPDDLTWNFTSLFPAS